jgi:hypothetical protein
MLIRIASQNHTPSSCHKHPKFQEAVDFIKLKVHGIHEALEDEKIEDNIKQKTLQKVEQSTHTQTDT